MAKGPDPPTIRRAESPGDTQRRAVAAPIRGAIGDKPSGSHREPTEAIGDRFTVIGRHRGRATGAIGDRFTVIGRHRGRVIGDRFTGSLGSSGVIRDRFTGSSEVIEHGCPTRRPAEQEPSGAIADRFTEPPGTGSPGHRGSPGVTGDRSPGTGPPGHRGKIPGDPKIGRAHV